MRTRFALIGAAVAIGVGLLAAIPATTATAAPALTATAATPSPYGATAGIGHTTLRGRAYAAPTLSAAAYRAAAATPPVVIGVDNVAPPGKNWEYTHYFPESNVNVPQGGVVLFQWNQGDNNGFHSVTFVPTGQTEAQVRAAYPAFAPDGDDGAGSLPIEPAIANNPTDLTCSTSPQSPPCSFDGTKVVSSGTIPTSVGAAFAVQIAPTTAPGTYTYVCLVHPNMSGTLNVVAAGKPATSPGALASQAASELSHLNAGAAAAEAKADVPTFTLNADGTRTWHERVGLTVDDVELLEYLPPDLPIHKGDSVNFDASGTTQEIHTVTTPGGGNDPAALPFQPAVCEAASGPDTPANPNVSGPPYTGCADPSGYEQPFNLGQVGPPTDIPSPATPASLTLVGPAGIPPFGVPASHTYKLTNNGTYAFFCFFHSNMGAVISTQGYRLGGSDGSVYTLGNLDSLGAGAPDKSPVAAVIGTQDQQGYWTVSADGHTKAFGDAANLGNTPVTPASPIVGGAAVGNGRGLYLVAKDGGVFALGAAQYFGSMGGKHLNAPIVGIATSQGDSGYDLVASDGGVFNFGTDQNGGSRFLGSMGGKHLNSPIVGIADVFDGTGYIMAAADGGVFTFGGAVFRGSEGGAHLDSPVVGITASIDAPGLNGQEPSYRLVTAAGGVYTFGASFAGSVAGTKLPAPIVSIAGDGV